MLGYGKTRLTRLFLPTPSARRATEHFGQQRDRQPISTHALREEGDLRSSMASEAAARFLPTPSARRATFASWAGTAYDTVFLPTPSARRATSPGSKRARPHKFLPTPSARRATAIGTGLVLLYQFLPTPSARRATGGPGHPVFPREISTHALREEGDRARSTASPAWSNFYPRPPRGGRPPASP